MLQTLNDIDFWGLGSGRTFISHSVHVTPCPQRPLVPAGTWLWFQSFGATLGVGGRPRVCVQTLSSPHHSRPDTLSSFLGFHKNTEPTHTRQLSWKFGHRQKESHVSTFHSNLPETALRPSSQSWRGPGQGLPCWPLPHAEFRALFPLFPGAPPGTPRSPSASRGSWAVSWFPNLQCKPISRVYKWKNFPFSGLYPPQKTVVVIYIGWGQGLMHTLL